jgi:hypothetical protein
MKVRKVSAAAKLSMVTVAALSAVFATASPAVAADDTFWAIAGSSCPSAVNVSWEGFAQFQDYGPGAPGGGNNDDYIIVVDDCPNGAGIKAWAWLDGVLLGSKYNGNGAGTTVVWDPFGNVTAGQSVGLKVCSVNGNSGTPYHCASVTRKIIDG